MRYMQAGAGPVADAFPENEWRETRSNARVQGGAEEIAPAALDTRLEGR